MDIFSIFVNMKICYVFSLKLPKGQAYVVAFDWSYTNIYPVFLNNF